MILNNLQYNLSKDSLGSLAASLSALPEQSSLLVDMQRSSIQSQIVELTEEITTYESLVQGNFAPRPELNVVELPEHLISARIAKQIPQEDVARYLDIPVSKVMEYESSQFSGVCLTRILKIASYLDVEITKLFKQNTDNSIEVIYEPTDISSLDWSSFPIKEISKRGWLPTTHQLSPIEHLKNFIAGSFSNGLAPALHRKTSYAGKKPRELSLLAWQGKVLDEAKNILEDEHISEFVLDDSWIPELVSLSKSEKGPLLAKDYLAEKGIILVYEPHLDGTYLDGAAMLSESGNPIIGITIRHDRIDNFWFVLLHELGHVFLHLSTIGAEFIDENVGDEGDSTIEKQADYFALDALIRPEAWVAAVSRIMPSPEAVKGDAIRMNVHEAIVAGRLRKEKSNYRLMSDLVGYGKVRNLFQ